MYRPIEMTILMNTNERIKNGFETNWFNYLQGAIPLKNI